MSKLEGRFYPITTVMAAATAAALLVSPLADAQQTPRRQSERSVSAETALEEIIVTAQKRTERLIEVPMSVSVMQGDVLENLGISSVAALSSKIPGLVVQETGPGTQKFTMRGLGASLGVAMVGVYLDEVDMTAQASRVQAGSSQLNYGLYDLERVEVLHGPQGTLWGAGSVGGTLRFITNKPKLDRFGAKVDVSSFGQADGDVSYEIKGAINLPIVEGVFGARVAATYQDLGGWIDQPAAGREDFNDSQLANVRTSLSWRPTDEFQVYGTVVTHRSEGNGLNTVNIEPFSEHLYQPYLNPTAETPFEDNYDHYNLTMSYDFGPVTLLSASGYTDVHHFETNARFQEFHLPPSPPLHNDGFGTGTSDLKLFTQELRLTSNGDGALSWTAGAFHREEKERSNLSAAVQSSLIGSPPFGPPFAFLFDSQTKNESVALFGDASYALTERWKVGAGVRYFEEDRADILNNQQGTFDDTSPRLYASYAPTRDISFYVNYSQGFRSGGFNAAAAVAGGAQLKFQPENVESYELGTKMSLLDGRFYLELAAFFQDYSDMQALGVLPLVNVNEINNIGRSEIQGVEYAFQWLATEQLTLGLTGVFLDTQITELAATQTAQRVGDEIDLAAKYNFSASADYNFNWQAGTPGFVRLSFSEQGPVKYTQRNAGLFVPVSSSDTLSFLNASIGVQFGQATVELFGRNLLDESGVSSPFTVFGFAPQPRPMQYGVRFAYDME